MSTEQIAQSLGEITQWQKDHERHDDTRFIKIEERLDKIETSLDAIPTRDEFRDMVKDSMFDAIRQAGQTTKMTIVTIATIVGAIAVISGGLKWILGWIGFEYIVK